MLNGGGPAGPWARGIPGVTGVACLALVRYGTRRPSGGIGPAWGARFTRLAIRENIWPDWGFLITFISCCFALVGLFEGERWRSGELNLRQEPASASVRSRARGGRHWCRSRVTSRAGAGLPGRGPRADIPSPGPRTGPPGPKPVGPALSSAWVLLCRANGSGHVKMQKFPLEHGVFLLKKILELKFGFKSVELLSDT
jgi:hypothetical protein